MSAKRKILIGGAAAVLITAGLLIPRRAWSGQDFSFADVPLPFGLTDGPLGDNKAQALGNAQYYNGQRYGGWFSDPKHSIADMMAIWKIESNFNPRAINVDDGGPGNSAYGIGQVLRTTAGDFQVTNPESMFHMRTGVRVSMDYAKWCWEYLAERLGRNPTKSEWIGSYNAGVGNALRGRLPVKYLASFNLARLAA